ncbi:MAG TPA: lysophospholipid acyltransferase family protein [Candidatus Thermoplasmatota archaeon]|nr:lysophospholipid acyltransferase family protein [Candidatus Thermoplasmatota archaeon]
MRPAREGEDPVRLYRAIYRAARRPNAAVTRLRVDGLHHIPEEGGLIVASNHLSWWDPVILGTVLPRPIHFLAKKEVFRGPFTNWFFSSAGAIPVDRQKGGNIEALAAAVRVIETGGVVGIFPEGTRAAPGRTLPPRTGVARLALATGAPVLPVAVLSDRFWGRGRATPRFGETVYVAVGPPVSFPRDPAAAADANVTPKVTADIFDRVVVELGRAEAARAAGAAWPRMSF